MRWLGAIGVVETHQLVDMENIQQLFIEHGVWIRPFGRLIYVMPPFIATPEQITHLVKTIELALNNDDCFQYA